jgi:hypothetical protein
MRTGVGQSTHLSGLDLKELLAHVFHTVCVYDQRRTKTAKAALIKQIREIGYRCGDMLSDEEINKIVTEF